MKINKLLDKTARVTGDGPVPCVRMIVGEAPGKNEVEQKRPFVGRSGKFLVKILESNGLQRSDVYITNIVKFRPYALVNARKKDRKPDRSEIRKYLPSFLKELNRVRPKITLLTGLTPLNAIFPQYRQLKTILGKTLRRDGIRFIATFHPAVVNRNATYKKQFLKDVKRFSKMRMTVFFLLLFLRCADFSIAESKVFKNIYRKTSSVLYFGNYLICGAENGKWVSSEKALNFVEAGSPYKLCGLTKKYGEGIGKIPAPSRVSCSTAPAANLHTVYRIDFSTVQFDSAFYNMEMEMIGIRCDWNPMPNRPEISTVYAPENRTVEDEVRKIFEEKRMRYSREKSIRQIIKVDLNGDKKIETLVSAVSRDRMGEGGALHSILLYCASGDQSGEILAEGFYPEPGLPRISFVLDGDGDGTLEIFVDADRDGKHELKIFKFDGEKAEEVYSVACYWQ